VKKQNIPSTLTLTFSKPQR